MLPTPLADLDRPVPDDTDRDQRADNGPERSAPEQRHALRCLNTYCITSTSGRQEDEVLEPYRPDASPLPLKPPRHQSSNGSPGATSNVNTLTPPIGQPTTSVHSPARSKGGSRLKTQPSESAVRSTLGERSPFGLTRRKENSALGGSPWNRSPISLCTVGSTVVISMVGSGIVPTSSGSVLGGGTPDGEGGGGGEARASRGEQPSSPFRSQR